MQYDGRIELAAYVQASDTDLTARPTDEFLALLIQIAGWPPGYFGELR